MIKVTTTGYLETIDYIESFIFEGFIMEITELIQETLTDKSDDEISDLMEIWWGSIEIMHEDGDNDIPAKEGKKVESDYVDVVKKIHPIIINEIWNGGLLQSDRVENIDDWMWDMEWGKFISFDDDDKRGEFLRYSLKLIFNPNIMSIKV